MRTRQKPSTHVHITINGKCQLGAELDANTFTEEYVSSKVEEWITRLSAIASTQPHADYAAFTVSPVIGPTFPEQYLIFKIYLVLWTVIPTLTGQEAYSAVE